MTDDFDLGTAADWIARVEAHEAPHSFRPSIPREDLYLVATVAVRGHRTVADAQRILSSPQLQQHLARAWERHEPSPELRARLSEDAYGRSLLSLAPAAEAGPVPSEKVTLSLVERIFANVPRIAVAPPMAHAAASAGSLPLVFSHEDADAGVAVEGRGGVDQFALTLTPLEDAPLTRYIVVRVESGDDTTTLIAPLSTDVAPAAATLWTRFPSAVAVRALADDLSAAASDPDVRSAVISGVRAADGTTQNTWRVLARQLGPQSTVYDAIVEGFR